VGWIRQRNLCLEREVALVSNGWAGLRQPEASLFSMGGKRMVRGHAFEYGMHWEIIGTEV
jgi:hypothetical protein